MHLGYCFNYNYCIGCILLSSINNHSEGMLSVLAKNLKYVIVVSKNCCRTEKITEKTSSKPELDVTLKNNMRESLVILILLLFM